MKINRISISRNQRYESCHQSYKYRYHLEMIPETEQFYFTYGKIVHKIAEVYVIRGGKSLVSEVCQEVLEGKIPLEEGKFAPPLPYDYRLRLSEHLRNIKKITEKLGFEGLVEHKFKHDLEPPNEKYFEGVIDRVIIKQDRYFIVDYKTTKKGHFRKNTITITADLQLQGYARVLQKEFGAKAENISAALYYLEDGVLLPVRYCEKTLCQAEEELLLAYDKIKAMDADSVVGNPGEQCKRCEYAPICPFNPYR